MTMTREQIEQMEAGREMDALVTEKVIGSSVVRDYDKRYAEGVQVFTKQHMRLVPEYSTDIAAAWEVVEKAYELTGCTITVHLFGTYLRVNEMPKYMCKFYGGRIPHETFELETKAHADTAPLAICRASLLAVMELA